MLNKQNRDELFTNARTHNFWTDKPVSDELLHELYDLFKFGPTEANTGPARIVFVKSAEARARLVACMDKGNQHKVGKAPVTALIAMDMAFYEQMPKLFPHAADARSWYAGNQAKIDKSALRNSSLQAAYMMLAARSLGLDCGPMAGFDADKLNAEFFAGTTHKINFVCSLGYGELEKLHPRLPRLAFDEACRIA